MPRQYTQRAFIGGNIANAEDWNAELSSAGSELSGQLDQNNMPLDTVNSTRVAPAVVVTEVDNSGAVRDLITHTYMQSQSYHVSSSCLLDTNPGSLTYSTAWQKADWQLGWMRLAEKRLVVIGGTTYYAGSELRFDSKEGMVVGEAFIDATWRGSYLTGLIDGVGVGSPRVRNFAEFGVFVNDVCVARTGLQFLGGRFTFVIPYSTPVATQECFIDLRFRLQYTNQKKSSTFTVVTEDIAPFTLGDSGVWARNQYR
jgi:hypothetical protein